MKTIYAFDIEYDTDDDGNDIMGPDKLKFMVDDCFNPREELADLISDETGFLVMGCRFSYLKN